MRILYITLENLWLHKGSVVHIREVIDGLQKRGHQVGLVGRAWTKVQNVDPHSISSKTLFLFKILWPKGKSYFLSSVSLFLYLLRVLRQYDIIYARDFHTAIIALIPRLMFRKKLVLEINGIAHEEQSLKDDSIVRKVFVFLIQKAEKIAANYSDRVISVTPQIAAYLTQRFGCSSSRIEVVGNGVNTEIFLPIQDDQALMCCKKRLGIEEKEGVIAFVGNLASWQGVGVLVESAARLLAKENGLKFLIVGEGLVKADLEEKVMDWKLSRSFIFTGMVDYKEIPILINISDICVAPFISRRNRKTGVSPLKVFEYMACGKPVVASRIEGLEFIEEEEVGRLVDPEDVIGLERALNALMKNPQERMRMGQKGLQVARERFSWESRITKIEVVLKKMA